MERGDRRNRQRGDPAHRPRQPGRCSRSRLRPAVRHAPCHPRHRVGSAPARGRGAERRTGRPDGRPRPRRHEPLVPLPRREGFQAARGAAVRRRPPRQVDRGSRLQLQRRRRADDADTSRGQAVQVRHGALAADQRADPCRRGSLRHPRRGAPALVGDDRSRHARDGRRRRMVGVVRRGARRREALRRTAGTDRRRVAARVPRRQRGRLPRLHRGTDRPLRRRAQPHRRTARPARPLDGDGVRHPRADRTARRRRPGPHLRARHRGLLPSRRAHRLRDLLDRRRWPHRHQSASRYRCPARAVDGGCGRQRALRRGPDPQRARAAGRPRRAVPEGVGHQRVRADDAARMDRPQGGVPRPPRRRRDHRAGPGEPPAEGDPARLVAPEDPTLRAHPRHPDRRGRRVRPRPPDRWRSTQPSSAAGS